MTTAQQSFKTGELYPGQGIYLGAWEPRNRQRQSLGKIFNVFAAPTDLLDAQGRRLVIYSSRCSGIYGYKGQVANFDSLVNYIAELKDFYGHDGAFIPSDADIIKAIQTGDEKHLENWFMPTREILDGGPIEGIKKEMPNNLRDHKFTGVFNGTLQTSYDGDIGTPWYGSCTRRPQSNPYAEAEIWQSCFCDGGRGWSYGNTAFSTRLVRAVYVGPA